MTDLKKMFRQKASDRSEDLPLLRVRSDLRAGEGGGWVNGVWYPDMSGTCGESTVPPGGGSGGSGGSGEGGGWVNGVWYPDMSGYCG